jgi:hypothetical protein
MLLGLDEVNEVWNAEIVNKYDVQAKTTKKVVLKMECTECKYKKQVALKRCKHFELGGDKKKKVRKYYYSFMLACKNMRAFVAAAGFCYIILVFDCLQY